MIIFNHTKQMPWYVNSKGVLMFKRVDVDFWSSMIEMTVEEKIAFEDNLLKTTEDWNADLSLGKKPFGFKVSPWKSKDYRSGYWLVSLWGTNSGVIALADNRFHTNVTRVDLRATYLNRFPNFSELSGSVVGAYKGRKNVHMYNSKVREKSESRDRGGCGFAFGSLKSQERVSVYTPGRTPELAIEVQFRGEKAMACASELIAVYEERNAILSEGADDDVGYMDMAEAVFEVLADDTVTNCLGMHADVFAEQAHSLSRDTALKIANHHMKIAAQFLEPEQLELPL